MYVAIVNNNALNNSIEQQFRNKNIGSTVCMFYTVHFAITIHLISQPPNNWLGSYKVVKNEKYESEYCSTPIKTNLLE